MAVLNVTTTTISTAPPRCSLLGQQMMGGISRQTKTRTVNSIPDLAPLPCISSSPSKWPRDVWEHLSPSSIRPSMPRLTNHSQPPAISCFDMSMSISMSFGCDSLDPINSIYRVRTCSRKRQAVADVLPMITCACRQETLRDYAPARLSDQEPTRYAATDYLRAQSSR